MMAEFETFTQDQLRKSPALSALCEVGMHDAILEIWYDVKSAIEPWKFVTAVWIRDDPSLYELAWRIFTIENTAFGRQTACAECYKQHCLEGGMFYLNAAEKCTHEVFF